VGPRAGPGISEKSPPPPRTENRTTVYRWFSLWLRSAIPKLEGGEVGGQWYVSGYLFIFFMLSEEFYYTNLNVL